VNKFCVLLILVGFLGATSIGQTYYHLADFSDPEPIIIKRCVKISEIRKSKSDFIKEDRDILQRCKRIEFYERENVLWGSVDMPSIITYTWTDSSIIELLFGSDHELLSQDGYMIRPNKIEYMTKDTLVLKRKEFFNNKFLMEARCTVPISLEKASFFLMYSGCSIKYNEKYRLQF